jgi:hypothetical protein
MNLVITILFPPDSIPALVSDEFDDSSRDTPTVIGIGMSDDIANAK